MKMNVRMLLMGTAAMVATVSPSAVVAQGSQEGVLEESSGGSTEIVVTARRRGENLQDVPVSVTVLDQDSLNENAVLTAFDLPKATPGLTVNADQGNPSLASFSIRGRGQSTGAAAGSVETYFADVPLSAPFGSPSLPAQFFDLQSVQVLRGPQGTLFGRSTTGGAVLLVPQAPTDQLEGYVRAQYGTLDTALIEGAVNLPLGDIGAVRLAGFYHRREGYMHGNANDPFGNPIINDFTGTPIGEQFYNNVNTLQLRGTLLLEPTDGIANSTIVTYHRDKTRSSGGSGLLNNGGTVIQYPGFGTFEAYINVDTDKPAAHAWAIVNTTTISIADNLTLKNIFGYINSKGYLNDGADGDGLPFSIISVYTPPRPRKHEQFTNELQLQGTAFDNRFNWIVGGLYDKSKDPTDINNINYSSVNPTYMFGLNPQFPRATSLLQRFIANNDSSYALFASGTYSITDKLSISGGYRHTWDTIRTTKGLATLTSSYDVPVVTLPPQLQTAKFENDAYQAGIEYKANADTLLYTSYRRGYKKGAYNPFNTDNTLAPFDVETIDSFALGFKTTLYMGDVTARFNVEGFYDKYRNMQVSYLDLAAGGGLQSVTINVPKSRYRGFDADLVLEISNWFQLTAAYSLNDADHTSWPDPSPGSARNLAENPVPYVSKHNVFIAPRFSVQDEQFGEFVFRPSLSYQSSFWRDPFVKLAPLSSPIQFNQFAVGGANVDVPVLVDLRLEWNEVSGSPVSLAVTATNLLNKIYSIGNSGTLNFGAQSNTYAPPRIVTAEVSFKF